MKVTQLMKELEYVLVKYGDIEIDILTETKKTGQVEQELGGIAVSVGKKRSTRLKLLPEGF